MDNDINRLSTGYPQEKKKEETKHNLNRFCELTEKELKEFHQFVDLEYT